MSYLEKRKSQRWYSNNFISYCLLDENDKIFGEGYGITKNISDVGLQMETGKIIESDYILVVATDERNKLVGMKGKVCHSIKDETGVIITGIEFVDDDDKKSQFAKHLKKAYRMNKDSSILRAGF